MKYEVLEAGNYYHIFNQGNNKENIFIEEQNYLYFLLLIKRYVLPIASILSYCLMKNHFHLVVKTKHVEDKKISKAFSNLFNAYAKAINKKYNRSGSLFRDRFKRIKVNDEKYLKQLIIYVNLNPIYHQFKKEISNYKYSSYNALISEKPTLLLRDSVITMFENKDNFIYALKHKKIEFDEKLKEILFE